MHVQFAVSMSPYLLCLRASNLGSLDQLLILLVWRFTTFIFIVALKEYSKESKFSGLFSHFFISIFRFNDLHQETENKHSGIMVQFQNTIKKIYLVML